MHWYFLKKEKGADEPGLLRSTAVCILVGSVRGLGKKVNKLLQMKVEYIN